MKITKAEWPAIVAEVTRRGRKDVIIFDETLPGFGVRFRHGSNRQSFVFQYERGGYQKRIVLGHTGNLDPSEARIRPRLNMPR